MSDDELKKHFEVNFRPKQLHEVDMDKMMNEIKAEQAFIKRMQGSGGRNSRHTVIHHEVPNYIMRHLLQVKN